MPRFVIHRHEVPSTFGRPSHWDVMLEEDPTPREGQHQGDAGDTGHELGLLTWAVERLPIGMERVPARRLDNHRREYLDYEGPVSGGRGSVCRWDAGTVTWLERGGDFVRVRVVGARWRGIISLRREAADESSGPLPQPSRSVQRWLLEFTADD